MTNEVKDFIEQNIELIDMEFFELLYHNASHTFNSGAKEIGELTAVLQSAGIFPLEYMSTVPNFFVFNKDIKKIIIPSNIKGLRPLALFRGDLSLTDEGFNEFRVLYEGTVDQWFKLADRQYTFINFAGQVKAIECSDGIIYPETVLQD